MKRILFLLLFVFFSCSLISWDPNGHMTCGAVAYYYLKNNNPAVLNKVLTVLKKHPWFTKPEWTDKLAGLTAEQKNVRLFMLASTFPDDARPTPLGGDVRATWHYINYPFVPPGVNIPAPAVASPNAEVRINQIISTVATNSIPDSQAIDLCWLFHLIEDIHMPLHAATLITQAHPAGDKGGNETFIRFPSSTMPVRLHTYWDALVKGTVSNIPAHAKALLNEPKYKESNLPEIHNNPSVHDWTFKESFQLAKNKVYLNGAVKGSQSSPTAVTAGYANTAKVIGEKRVVVAGIRLAKKLIEIFH